MAKYLIDSTDIEIEEVSGTQNLKMNFASGNSLETQLNNLSNYSTTETVIGEWLGDTLYRKVINFGALPNATAKDVNSGLSDVNIKKIGGYCESSVDLTCLNLPHLSSQAEYNISILYRYNTNSVEIYTGTDRTSYNAYVVLEYTKN